MVFVHLAIGIGINKFLLRDVFWLFFFFLLSLISDLFLDVVVVVVIAVLATIIVAADCLLVEASIDTGCCDVFCLKCCLICC